MEDPSLRAQNNQQGSEKSVELEETFFLNQVLLVIKAYIQK